VNGGLPVRVKVVCTKFRHKIGKGEGQEPVVVAAAAYSVEIDGLPMPSKG